MRIKIYHGEQSRISNKVIKTLKKCGAFKITSLKTPLHLRSNPEHIYEHWLELKAVEENDNIALKSVRSEIMAAIPELFPKNYLFKIADNYSTSPLFSYRLEFQVTVRNGTFFNVYCKIKEQKKDSKPINTYQIEVS